MPHSPPKTFVLVHGAWHGGWCWRRVADRLGARGHRVFTPTLTGLGERAHLLHPKVDLSLHVADVLGVIKYEQLKDVVLVGHSYGGCVISGVAEAMPDKIGSIVFLDAFIPDNGDATLDLVQPAVQEIIRAALERGDTTVPVRDAAAFRVNEKDRDWVDSLAGPQPIRTMTETIRLTARANEYRRRPTSARQAIPMCRSTRPMRA
ncbi:MAG: alpha/beta fold hydrolase [Pseudolabrys sp.]